MIYPVAEDGALAQLGERYTGSVEVSGSIPLCSTISPQVIACGVFLSMNINNRSEPDAFWQGSDFLLSRRGQYAQCITD